MPAKPLGQKDAIGLDAADSLASLRGLFEVKPDGRQTYMFALLARKNIADPGGPARVGWMAHERVSV